MGNLTDERLTDMKHKATAKFDGDVVEAIEELQRRRIEEKTLIKDVEALKYVTDKLYKACLERSNG